MKKLFNAKTGLRGLYALVAAVAFIVVVVLNIVMGLLADRYPMNIDLTSDSVVELGDETLDFIGALEEPVKIQVLATEEKFVNTTVYNAQANEIMREFARRSDNIDISYIDYVADPTFAASYPDYSLKEGDVIVSSDERSRQVKTEELFNYTYSQTGGLSIASSRAEEAILSAVLYVVSDELTTVAAIEGHGETSGSAFLDLLGDNNYEVSTANLLLGGLTEGTDVALIIAPTTDYTEETYSSLLKDTSIPVLVPVCRPLEVLYSFMENYTTTTLLTFGESAGVRPSDAGEDFSSKDAEIWGPIPAVVMSSYRLMDSTDATKEVASYHVIVSGSSEMLADYTLYNTAFSNAGYMVSLLNELCGRDGMIAVTPKSIVGNALNLNQAAADTIGMVFIAVIPALMLVFGLVVWLTRRHK